MPPKKAHRKRQPVKRSIRSAKAAAAALAAPSTTTSAASGPIFIFHRQPFQSHVPISFAWPWTTQPETIFPPAWHTDGTCVAGNRLLSKNCTFDGGQCRATWTPHPSDQRAAERTWTPVLSSTAAHAWTQPVASKMAATYLQFPASTVRLLGTITRSLVATTNLTRPPPVQRRAVLYPGASTALKGISASDARKSISDDASSATLTIEAQVAQIQHSWKQLLSDDPAKPARHVAPWDNHGDWISSRANDADYVPPSALLTWLRKQIALSRNDEYDELVAVLEACLDLSNPDSLWDIPLLMIYPVVKEGKIKKHGTRTVEISMGVYCHRLLFEATTMSLGVILEALDPDSYVVTAPLVHGPSSMDVFASSHYPVVCIDDAKLSGGTAAAATRKENLAPLPHRRGANTNSGSPPVSNDVWMMDDQKDRDDTRISAFTAPGLLKLLENHGTDVSTFATHVAPRLQTTLRMTLMLHQEHAVAWMMQMEQLPGATFGINSLLWEEREFLDGGRYYVCASLGQVRLQPPACMNGGLLCDEMGLGKTIEILALIVATLPELKREAADDEDRSHSTVIVLPPALVSQWQNEIVKCTGEALTVDFLDFKTGSRTRRGAEGGDADIILTTYKALEYKESAKFLDSKIWGRVVLDEMQEIRSTTTKIAKSCEQLECDRRWMLSGTPLFDGIVDLRGELNFLRLEPFSANSEDGFFDFMITNPWTDHNPQAIDTLKVLSAVMLRRSKGMTIKATGAPILSLKPLTIEFVPVQQTNSERAIYYFLESIVARVLRTMKTIKSISTSRFLCLRLLRETCNSVLLLNGGLGAVSQLKAINTFMITDARRVATMQAPTPSPARVKTDRIPVMSCDEATVFLAQVQEATRTGEDEVAGLSLGFGQGLSRRVRATHTLDQKLGQAREALQTASSNEENAKSYRAKAWWHLALELITTGRLKSPFVTHIDEKFRRLWRWRWLVGLLPVKKRTLTLMPPQIQRGWRPSTVLLANWHLIHPEFYWAHANSKLLESIPVEVTAKEIVDSIAGALLRKGVVPSVHVAVQRFRLIELDRSSTYWNAGLQFDAEVDANTFNQSATAKGIIVSTASTISQVENQIAVNQTRCDDAKAAYLVHPTEENHSEQKKAERELSYSKLGLRIVQASGSNIDTEGVIRLGRSRPPYRTLAPSSSRALITNVKSIIKECKTEIFTSQEAVVAQTRIIQRLENAGGKCNLQKLEAMSSFETLQALSNGEVETTYCCICLDHLGQGEQNEDSTASILMTKCGHLYCRGCIEGSQTTKCPTCRKEFHPVRDVVYIDLSKTDDRTAIEARIAEAKKIVIEASQILEDSNGVLEPEMWDQLYLAIDEPTRADFSLDSRLSALPRTFLAHMRACNDGIALLGSPKYTPAHLDRNANYLSSKVKALLRDLPLHERSVVFSSSKATIQHLEVVLQGFNIGCRSLYFGQDVSSSESAVDDWQSEQQDNGSPTYPVLLVQAGAAASGLTLTAACKMFFLEPFLRLSEEHQACGRCHRHGQTKPVHVKCYYAPVSVESRLLEWRRRATKKDTSKALAASNQDAKIVYATMDGDSDEENDMSDDEADADNAMDVEDVDANEVAHATDGDDLDADVDQTNFLLGVKKTGNLKDDADSDDE